MTNIVGRNRLASLENWWSCLENLSVYFKQEFLNRFDSIITWAGDSGPSLCTSPNVKKFHRME